METARYALLALSGDRMFQVMRLPVTYQAQNLLTQPSFLAVADQWQRVRTMLSSTQRSLEYTLMQEFQQRLKNFQRNAEIVRKHNAKHSKEPDKVCLASLT